MQTTISVDPANPESLAEARAALDRLEKIHKFKHVQNMLAALALENPADVIRGIALLKTLLPTAPGIDFDQRITWAEIQKYAKENGFSSVFGRLRAVLNSYDDLLPLGELAKVSRSEFRRPNIGAQTWALLESFLRHKGTYPGAAANWSPPEK